MKKCRIFYERIHGKESLAHAIFKDGKINPEVLEDIKNYNEEKIEKVLKERKHDLEQWDELF